MRPTDFDYLSHNARQQFRVRSIFNALVKNQRRSFHDLHRLELGYTRRTTTAETRSLIVRNRLIIWRGRTLCSRADRYVVDTLRVRSKETFHRRLCVRKIANADVFVETA